MDSAAIAHEIGQQFMTAWNAPIPFLAAILALAVAIWLFVQREYATRLSNSDSTIKRLEGEVGSYKEKLGGSTPEAAQAHIKALQERIDQMAADIAGLAPRSLSLQQKQAMSRILDGFRGCTISIASDMAVADTAQLSRGLQAAFTASSWSLRRPMVMGVGNPPPTGLGIDVEDPNQLTPPQQAVVDALRAAGLAYDLRQGAPMKIHGQAPPVAEILLTAVLRDA